MWAILPFWHLWTQLGSSPRREGCGSLGAKFLGFLVGLLVDRVRNGRSDLQAGVEIYYCEHTEFWLISSSQNDPISGPQFPPFRVVNRRPHFSNPIGSLDLNLKLYTQIEVLGPASYPVSHWPYLGRASHAWK